MSKLLKLRQYLSISECFILQVQSLILGVKLHDIQLGKWPVKILTQLTSDLDSLILGKLAFPFLTLALYNCRRSAPSAALVNLICHRSLASLKAKLFGCVRQVHGLVCMSFG